MRVRPFFWLFLALACTGILIFSANISVIDIPMQAHIDQVSTASTHMTSVLLTLTDPEGEPIAQAQITPQAYMLTMSMGPQQISVRSRGQGLYLAEIHFSMAGLWHIDITAHADGFHAAQESLQLTVV